jgi:hypothetical protein
MTADEAHCQGLQRPVRFFIRLAGQNVDGAEVRSQNLKIQGTLELVDSGVKRGNSEATRIFILKLSSRFALRPSAGAVQDLSVHLD